MLAPIIKGSMAAPGGLVSIRVVTALVVGALLLSACGGPSPADRPRDGAPVGVGVKDGAVGKGGAGPPELSGAPPTLSAPGQPTPAASPSPGGVTLALPSPSPSASPAIGPPQIIAATDGRGANLRDAPGTQSRVITTLAEGTVVEVLSAPVNVGGQPWRLIRSGSREGWVLALVLRPR
jgi:hypothetical protein